jgi:hypothetical protein
MTPSQGDLSINHFKPDQVALLWIDGEVPFFRHPVLSRHRRLVHGIFTRHGGVSSPPYHTLNISDAVGDRSENVAANLEKVRNALGAHRLVFMNQAHGDRILVVRQSAVGKWRGPSSADALLTDTPCLGLMVKQADCQAVILYDPNRHMLANVHCGWRGNVQNVLGQVVDRMKREFGCQAQDLIAAIGPSLGPCCAEFVNHGEIFPSAFKRFMVRRNHFDLQAISRWQLAKAGLRETNIEVAGICTRCRTDLFFSYRGEGKTGRFATVAMLR